MNDLIPSERIEKRILLLRGQKVMLSTDLAELYEVVPKVLVQAVKRNSKRFPCDFMFQLKYKITRESFPISFYLFVETLGGYAVKPRQVVIQDDLLPTDEQDDLLDSLSWYEVLHCPVRHGLDCKSYSDLFSGWRRMGPWRSAARLACF